MHVTIIQTTPNKDLTLSIIAALVAQQSQAQASFKFVVDLQVLGPVFQGGLVSPCIGLGVLFT